MEPQPGKTLDGGFSPVQCERMKQELRCFSFLSDVELGKLSPYFSCRVIPARTDLWQSGENDDFVAFIISGRIELKVDTEFPGKQVVVGVFSRGAVVGVDSVLNRQPRTSTARAMEDASLVLLSRKNFEELLTLHPQAGIHLLKGMLLSESHRLSRAYARLASIF